MKIMNGLPALAMLVIASLLDAAAGEAVSTAHVKHHRHHKKHPIDADELEDSLDDPPLPAADAEMDEVESLDEAPIPPPVKHHHSKRALRAVAKKLGRSPTVVAAKAGLVDSLASLRHDLKQEQHLRLTAEKLVHKLTGVLNHTTEALQRKDREAEAETLKEKSLQQELSAAHAGGDKEKSLRAELSNEHHLEKDLRAQQATAAAANVQCMKTLSSERALRVAAEKNVTRMTARLQSIGRQRASSTMDPFTLKKEVDRLQAENKKLVLANAEAMKEVERLKDNVDEAEAARKAKTQELKNNVNEIDNLKKKEKADLAALQLVDQNKIAVLKKEFKDEEAKQESAFKSKDKESQEAIAKLSKKASDLNTTAKSLETKVSEEEQHLKKEMTRAEKAEEKVEAEHKAVLKADAEIATQKDQLNKDNAEIRQLNVKADELRKAQQKIDELGADISTLNATIVDGGRAMEETKDKLKTEGNTLKITRKKLKDTSADLHEAEQARERSDKRAHQLFEALNQKKAQLQIHDEELVSTRQELNSASEQKDVLAKELSVTEAKLSKKANEEKELAADHEKLSEVARQILDKGKEIDVMRQHVKAADEKTQEFDTMKAQLVQAAAEKKELADQLSLSKQLEKDRVAAAAAKEQELNVALAAAYKREKDLKVKTSKQHEEIIKQEKSMHDAYEEEAKLKANKLADELNAEQALHNQEAGSVQSVTDDEFLLSGGAEKLVDSVVQKNGTKAALLVGKTVLKRQVNAAKEMQVELAMKDKQLKSALASVQSLQVDAINKETELESARLALLHAASVALPTKSAQEANAARIALEEVDGKLDAQERELNASRAELAAANTENSMETKEVQILKDDHAALGKKVENLEAAVLKEQFLKQKLSKELLEVKANVSAEEKSRQELLQRSTVLEKVAKAAKERDAKEAAEKAAAAKQAAEQQAAAEKAAAAQRDTDAKALADQQAAQAPEQVQPSPKSDDGDDDSSDDGGDGAPEADDAFAATVPWNSMTDKLAKRLRGQ